MFERAEKSNTLAGQLQIRTLYSLAQPIEERRKKVEFLPDGDIYVGSSREAREVIEHYARLIAEAGGSSFMVSYAEDDGYRIVDLYPGNIHDSLELRLRNDVDIFSITWDGVLESPLITEKSLLDAEDVDDRAFYDELLRDWQGEFADSFIPDGFAVYDIGYHGPDEWLTEMSWMTDEENKASENWKAMGAKAIEAYESGVPLSDIVA